MNQSSSRFPTAAAVIIGDEILSGKVPESNLSRLIPCLRDEGVQLQRVVFVPDELLAIADEVERCAARYAAVITSGGIGPTHDDITVAGVARAFSVPVVRHPELETLVRHRWQGRLTEAALRLADVPEGAHLLYGGDNLLPLVVMRNVYLLPGVPRLFERKLETLRRELGGGAPLHLRTLTVTDEETAVAATLTAVAGAFPQVKIGSYPQGRRKVWITVEGADTRAVAEAAQRLAQELGERVPST